VFDRGAPLLADPMEPVFKGVHAMILQTSRFGQVEVDESRLITFEEGILGFPQQQNYALIQTGRDSGFYWLQSVDTRDLAFVVCDPRLFVADFQAPVKADELQGIGLTDLDKAQVFIIVNKVQDLLTGNFQGPLVVNVQNRRGKQLVLSDRRYSTRHPLIRLTQGQALARTA
jgi:flagellar assembly factor FliW